MRTHLGLALFLLVSGLLWSQSSPVRAKATIEKPPRALGGGVCSCIRPNDGLELVSGAKVAAYVVENVLPIYPEEARQKSIQGDVVLHFVVGPDSTLLDVKPIAGPKELLPAAIAAVKQWTFRTYFKPVTQGQDAMLIALNALNIAPPKTQGTPQRKWGSAVTMSFKLPDRVIVAFTTVLTASPKVRTDVPEAVMKARLICQAPVKYPLTENRGKLSLWGQVGFRAVIGSDGRVKELKALYGSPELVRAAEQAVKQWEYAPYSLDEKPMEVTTLIVVNVLPPATY